MMSALASELALLATSLLVLLAAGNKGGSSRFPILLSAMGSGVAMFMAWNGGLQTSDLFGGLVHVDSVTQLIKSVVILASIVSVILLLVDPDIRTGLRAEFCSILLLTAANLCLFVSSSHLILSIAAYTAAFCGCVFLATFQTNSRRSGESGIKMFCLFATGLVIFTVGALLFFSSTQTFAFAELREKIVGLHLPRENLALLWVAFGSLFVAIAALGAFFPMQFAFPDIIQGAPTASAAFLLTAPLASALGMFFRFCLSVFSQKNSGGDWMIVEGFEWQNFTSVVASATLILGTLSALGQKEFHRLIAFGALAQGGLILAGFSLGTQSGLVASLSGLLTYAIGVWGAFLVFAIVRAEKTSEKEATDLSTFRSLTWKSPLLGGAFCIFLITLAGIPPFSGFLARFFTVGQAIKSGRFELATVCMILWIVALPWYFAPVREAVVRQTSAKTSPVLFNLNTQLATGVLFCLLLPLLTLGVYWDPFLGFISRVVQSLNF